MSKSLDRSQRAGSDPLIIGSSKLATDSNNNLSVLDSSDAPKKLIASELEIGDSSSKVIIKKGSDNKVQFQTQASGGSVQDSNAGGGVTVVANTTALQALTNNAVGDLAFVSANNKLYLRQTNGWYTVATVSNATPIISSAGNASYTFDTSGTPIVITVTATDAEGESITYGHTVTGSASGIATITQGTGANVNQFTLTPAISGSGGNFSVVFTAQDPNGNTATSSASSFSLSFFSAMKIPSGTTLLFGLSMDNIPSGLNLYASGTGGATTLASNSAFDFGTNDFTIEFFYRWEGTNDYQTVLAHHDHTATGGLMMQSVHTARKWGLFGDVATYPTYESTQATKGYWHHYALVRNNNVVKLYRNGTETLSKAHTGSIGSTNTSAIGAGSTGSYPAKGRISNLRVVKGTALYTSAGFTPPVAPLTAVSGTSLLLFQESSGSTLSDGSSNNIAVTKHSNHSILTNDGVEVRGKRGTWSLDLYDVTGSPLTEPTYVSSGGYHSTSNGHVHYSSPASTSNKGYRIPELDTNNACKGKTIICWYKGQSSQNVSKSNFYAVAVPILSDKHNRWFHIGIEDGKISVNSGNTHTKGTTNVCDNQWHMLTWIHSDGTHSRLSNDEMGMWVDGTYETKHTVYAYGNLRILNHMFTGGSGFVQHPERVDSFQIFDSELTDAQISEIYGS